jgi:hypothetical protein
MVPEKRNAGMTKKEGLPTEYKRAPMRRKAPNMRSFLCPRHYANREEPLVEISLD